MKSEIAPGSYPTVNGFFCCHWNATSGQVRRVMRRDGAPYADHRCHDAVSIAPRPYRTASLRRLGVPIHLPLFAAIQRARYDMSDDTSFAAVRASSMRISPDCTRSARHRSSESIPSRLPDWMVEATWDVFPSRMSDPTA